MAVERLALSSFGAALCLVDALAFLPPASLLSPPALGPVPVPRAASSCRSTAAPGTGDEAPGSSVGKPIDIDMTEGDDDLYVVGAGYLGKMVAGMWLEKFPSATVVCETRSVLRHVGDMPEGSTFVLRRHRLDYQRKYRNVVFTASPKGNQDYEHEVFQAAAHLWDGQGMLVMTSTGSIYAENEGGTVTEYSPVDNKEMTSRIIEGAENFAIGAGGCVIRLAGLYSVDRGPHNVWLTMKKVMQHPQGLINLLSYEDAADIVVSALIKGRPEPNPLDNPSGGQKIKGHIFLACDDQPTTRRDICEIALDHPFHGWKKMPEFEVTGHCRGQSGAKRLYDSSRTRDVLEWQPKWKSITEYFVRRVAEARERQGDEVVATAAGDGLID